MVSPILQIPGPEQSTDQAQEPAVVNLLGQDRYHDRVVERAETVGDVTLDEPHRPVPLVIDLPQCCVTTPARAETMGAIGELGLVVRLQHQADHFLHQLVRPRRQPQRTLLPGPLLVDVGPSHRGPPVPLLAEHGDDRLDLVEAHAVHGLPGRSRGYRPRVAVELAVGQQEQVRVEQASVDSFQWQSFPAAFTNDLQYGCGVPHLAYLTVVVDPSTCVPSPCRRLSRRPLAGRDSCDYYGHSVAIGLAPRRRSRIPLALDVSSVTWAARSVPLNRLIARRPPAGRVGTRKVG